MPLGRYPYLRPIGSVQSCGLSRRSHMITTCLSVASRRGRSGGVALYRTRLVSTRIPEREKRELAELAKSRPSHEWDPDACRAMLFAVLETAIRDYEYLETLRGRARRSSAQSKRARSMVEDNDPREFFDSTWFEEICHLLGLNHRAVRATVSDRVHGELPLPSRTDAAAEGLFV